MNWKHHGKLLCNPCITVFFSLCNSMFISSVSLIDFNFSLKHVVCLINYDSGASFVFLEFRLLTETHMAHS